MWKIQGIALQFLVIKPKCVYKCQQGCFASAVCYDSSYSDRITDVPMTNNMRKQNSTGGYENLPGLAKRFAANGGTGTATFQLYDDGWRLVNVTQNSSGGIIGLTTSERAEGNG